MQPEAHVMRIHAYFVTIAILTASPLAAQSKRETAVGLLLMPAGASIIPAGSETALAAKAGEVLFAGDVLKTAAAPATLLFCPAKSSLIVGPGSELTLQATAFKFKTGKAAGQTPVQSCFLPNVVRVSVASQQHYGVTMVRALKQPEEAKPTPRDKLDPAALAEIKPLDAALAANAKDQTALVARATIFEKYKLNADALVDYQLIAKEYPDAVWVKGKIFELEEAVAIAAAASPSTAGGQTFALLVGVSKYQKLPQDLWLQYAAADATTFNDHLRSPRGGAVPPANLMLLTDEKATTAALRNAFQTFLKGRAGKKDTVIVLIAGHGTVISPGSKEAYIVTYDSDPQDLASTALPMGDVQNLVQAELGNVGRVALFVDVCRAGAIGSIKSTTVNTSVEKLGEAEGEILGLMASRPKELSHEGPQFGGGHGAFTYFVLKALTGAADKNNDGLVNVNEVIEYVRTEVAKATDDKQHPRDFGTLSNEVVLADSKKPGIPLARWRTLTTPGGEALYFANAAAPQAPPQPVNDRFEEALRAGRTLPEGADNAFSVLRGLKPQLSPDAYFAKENELRVALEDRGQQVLLRYLEGDQVPQQQGDFVTGARQFEAALDLTPESLYLQGRAAFCRGRALLFDRKYAEAADLLERSVRLDSSAAYSYNALGIAYLEQADYRRAMSAFRDAIRRAPHWTYPLHNLALASIEAGEYTPAIRSYQKAIQLTPRVSYLHYNLGLLYQRLNRYRDAETAYRRAMEVAPGMADAYNALGSLKAFQKKSSDAEKFYREALAKNEGLLAARQNLASLLAEQPARRTEALTLWRDNLARSPEYLPSRLSLAETLAQQGDDAGAATEFRQVLQLKPNYVAAHLALAGVLEKSKDFDGALAELSQAARYAPQSADVLERTGDLHTARRQSAEAAAAYSGALKLAQDSAARKRLNRKLESARGQ
jgi:tetratricopeptide (TPR) repeat protein